VVYMPGDAPSFKYGSCKKNVCDASGQSSQVDDPMNFFDDGNPCTTKQCVNGVPTNNPKLNAMCGSSGFCELNPDPASPNGSVICAECDPGGDPTYCSSMIPGTTCVKGKCVPTHCTDGTQDFGETDTDCGGPMSGCLSCAATMKCTMPSDCFSGVCPTATHVCQAPTCTDNVKNGTESDIDCGGMCPKCADGATCTSPSDCMSGVCKPTGTNLPDRCQMAMCNDGVQNGCETGVDCGYLPSDAGLACPMCPPCH
jgi:hypothetical protein